MATITKELLDKIHKMDLISFMENKYGVVFRSKSARTANARCPHPDHHDKKPSFTAWKDKDDIWSWCCHSCHCGKHNNDLEKRNYGQDAIAFVRWMSDHVGSKHIYTFVEAVKIVAKYIGISISDDSPAEKAIFEQLRINKAVAEGCYETLISDKQHYAYQYIASRGLSDEDISEWKLGFNGERIVYPFFDINQRVIGFTMRLVKQNNNYGKYVNSKNSELFDKSSYLYGIHKINRQLNYLIITEGQMDVIAAYKYGLSNVVASSGTSFTDKHCQVIKNNFKNISRIIFVYDNDSAGIHGTKRAVEIARNNSFIAETVSLPDGFDLFDYMMKYKEDGAEMILNSSVPYFYIELKEEVAKYNTMILNFQANITPKLDRIMNGIKNQHEKTIFKSFVRSNFKIDTGGDNDAKEDYIETG